MCNVHIKHEELDLLVQTLAAFSGQGSVPVFKADPCGLNLSQQRSVSETEPNCACPAPLLCLTSLSGASRWTPNVVSVALIFCLPSLLSPSAASVAFMTGLPLHEHRERGSFRGGKGCR